MEAEHSPPLTVADLDAARLECRTLVTRRARISGAIAAVPLPFLDVAAEIGILSRLLPHISGRFELTDSEIRALDPESQTVVYGAIRGLGETLVGKAITQGMIVGAAHKIGARIAAKQAARLAPIVGQAASAGLSYALMQRIGQRHVEQCYIVARARAEMTQFGEGVTVIDVPAL